MSEQEQPRKRAATRSDVARIAGVSPSVVSYVLNPGSRPVAAETRERVLAAMEEVSFRPNSVARALRTRKTHTLGVLIPDLGNPYFAELARRIEDAARRVRHSALLSDFYDDPDIEAEQVDALLDRQVDGLIHVSPTTGLDRERLLAARIPVVHVDRITPDEDVHTIGADYYRGAQSGVEHLIGHGHTDIGIVSGTRRVTSVEERERGWANTLHGAGLDAGPRVLGDLSRQGGYEAGSAMLDAAERPSAVFVISDQQAIGVLHACHERGVRVPEDLAVVSFDGSLDANFTWPPLTTVQQPLQRIAALAVDMVTDESRAPRHEILPTSLLLGRSCGCP